MEDYFSDLHLTQIEAVRARAILDFTVDVGEIDDALWPFGKEKKRVAAGVEYLKAMCRFFCEHLERLRFLPPDADEYAVRVMEESRVAAAHPSVDRAAEKTKDTSLKALRAAYARELMLRKQRWAANPIYSTVTFDSEEEREANERDRDKILKQLLKQRLAEQAETEPILSDNEEVLKASETEEPTESVDEISRIRVSKARIAWAEACEPQWTHYTWADYIGVEHRTMKRYLDCDGGRPGHVRRAIAKAKKIPLSEVPE